MADYIRRDIVLKIINTVNDTGGFAGYADYCTLFDEIDTMPASDVQPVKHGHWEKLAIVPATDTGNSILARCSKCGDTMIHTTIGREITLKYCGHCGARMDGDTECK